jgi:hypothetical protein
MTHVHSVYDSDAHFSIDPITKAITDKSGKKSHLVQFDHNSERFTFDIPRTVEGHDMSLCNSVQVHFINMDKVTRKASEDYYEVEDLQVSPENDEVIVCSWLISQNATKYAGSLSFIVRFACVEDGVTKYAWNTDIFTAVSVSQGIYNAKQVEEEYSDAIAALMERVAALEGKYATVEQVESMINDALGVIENGSY